MKYTDLLGKFQFQYLQSNAATNHAEYKQNIPDKNFVTKKAKSLSHDPKAYHMTLYAHIHVRT